MQKQIIAHRGGPKLARENTLEAFKKALELGVDALELDVWKTGDGVLAVFHNPRISFQRISKISFAELNGIAAKKSFVVPTLEEALRLSAGKAAVKIEIKAEGYEDEVVETALKFLKPDTFSIISFNYGSLQKIKSKYHHIRTGLILDFEGSHFFKAINFLGRQKRLAKNIDFIVIHKLMWQAGMMKILPKHLPMAVWPADNPKFIRQLLKHHRVDGLVSNLPDLALQLKKEEYES